VNKRQYDNFAEFVRDVALICHNAQVYNRPSAPIFHAAVQLRNLFKQKLQSMVSDGIIKAGEAELPDLGEIPEVEDSPPPAEGDEDDQEGDEDEDEEEEEEDEDDDDSDDDGEGRKRRKRGRPSRKSIKNEDEDEAHKKRGRPAKVFTPMEARIHALLKGLRRFRNGNGEIRQLHFERLPDKAALPDYYTTIQKPISLDIIKTKAKRRKYANVDQVMADLDLMFENAKTYNEEDSQVYEDAVELQKEARELAEQERKRPDEAFRDEDGKLPLDSAEYNGETWRVGKWLLHFRRPATAMLTYR
jgi:chromatin structure-remodeling complex subunit RSC1/2